MGAAAAVVGGVQAALTYNQADQQAKSLKAQADYQKSMAEVNSLFSNIQASDAIARGDKAAQQLGRKTKQLIGSQRASLAAQGIEIDSGSALEIQQDTATLSKMDEMQLRNNAWREAWGYKVESSTASANAQIGMNTNRFQARQTLITGGIQAANQAYSGYSQWKGQ